MINESPCDPKEIATNKHIQKICSFNSATKTEVIDKNEFFAMMCPPGYKMETSEDKEGKMPLALGSANMLQTMGAFVTNITNICFMLQE